MAKSGSELELDRATTSAAAVEEKSWHLLAVLLKIGHPVYPEHLASQCRLFTTSPGFISHVISSPGSPLSVTDNGLITPSAAAVFALGRFFSVSGFGFQDLEPTVLRKRKGTTVDLIELSQAKRRLFLSSAEVNADGEDKKRLAISNEVRDISLERYAHTEKAKMRRNLPMTKFEPLNMHSGNAMIPLHIDDTNGECSGSPSRNFEHREADNDASTSMFQGEFSGSVIKASDSLFMTGSDIISQNLLSIRRLDDCNLFANLALPTAFQDPLLCNEALVGSSGFGKKMDDHFETFRHEYPEQSIHLMDHGIFKSNTCNDPIRESNEEEGMQVESSSKKRLICFGRKREKENVTQMVNPAHCREEQTTGLEPKNRMRSLNLDKDETVRNISTHSNYNIAQSSSKQFLESLILKGGQKNNFHPKSQILTKSVACNKFDNAQNVDQCKDDQKFITKQKLRQNRKENMAETTSVTPKGEKKAYPSFESFIIEEEEGSGGYGTVYRAQRKIDGKILAIKCPHENAHKNHVKNERKMLERFGGKNFLIKFEGSCKRGNSDCFVLEHFDHDRPEVLKKEIDIIQLQWYGYCMFTALACLHKEGVVHRDVKPGNFLFSRKLKKGYLIDFNLAMDLKQKYNIGSKSKPSLDASNNIPLSSGFSAPLVQDNNVVGSKPLRFSKREVADFKKNSELKRQVKQKGYTGSLKNCPDKAGGSLLGAQGTEGSGITSAKDVTSTRIPSAERSREPILYRGRKELLSLVQNSVQCTNSSSIKGPSCQRKRVTAPSGKADSTIFYLTPMPLHLHTAGILRSKGDGKQKREGSCVGTKGFRAPEVLFRSQFQGPKVDIWSAGVTLLYMVIGKTPFTGEPEQNIKDIAKLRGSEELWEVAKLHDREFFFPVELLDDRYLQSWDIERWCKNHTKRPEFLQHIPKSLFDLIDKCLTVNPRNRISAEEVLRHEFFASCQEKMMKQKMIRRGPSSDVAASETI